MEQADAKPETRYRLLSEASGLAGATAQIDWSSPPTAKMTILHP
jgi:hypothetical protein